ncbi:hypothetical protein KIW84_071124 [Lathyrus oleraceus]|uniref:Uncharacterized protein n=1 Tax=Pisum sativum TaxID=3888 RepID=A0A9D4VJV9_PEA|nr:hypothetical protein KIW84_071124 [Pisum sativum]
MLAESHHHDCGRQRADDRRASALARSWRGLWAPHRPVLKHGPRSLTCVRVNGRVNPVRVRAYLSGPDEDGELCLSGAKPEETLVEARSDTDVQILEPEGEFYRVKPMIRGIGGATPSTYSQTLIGRRVAALLSHAMESRAQVGHFGKQNWRCGMNRKLGYGAQLRAKLDPTKGVGRLDSRTVVMEVEIR